MEDNYNWGLISKVSGPIGLAVGIIFYLGISDGWKWFSMILGVLLAGCIVYFNDKKKINVFNASAIVFFIAIIIRFLRNFGYI